ncbi:LLM class flavin-dependent oxidoreductase, partial [Streptomyces sp. H28]|uniref:LLM class flavin-dependent oxidoreductase n=1 Tax=Streptomyces sp. H28 TaxID=2775865 RepID=UPI00177E401C
MRVGLALGSWGRGLSPGHLPLVREAERLGYDSGRPFPSSPLTATREYVDVVRQVLRRAAPVELDGRFHTHPYRGPGAAGLGRPLKPITHPLRPGGLLVLLGAEGPKNVAQTARIADGRLPLYWSPTRLREGENPGG